MGDKNETKENEEGGTQEVERGVINVESNGGIRLPEECLRGLESCEPYSQIVSDSGASFFCCGENDGTDREVKQDKYTICFKNKECDDRTHNDKRDLIHNAAVIMGALAVIEELDSEVYHEKSI